MNSFDYESIKRIVKAVLRVEKMPFDSANIKRPGIPVGMFGMWAVIGDKDESTPTKYKFKQLIAKDDKLENPPDTDDGLLVVDDYDENYAVEINGSKHVFKGSIVWLQPALSGDYFIFHYSPGVIKVKNGTEDSDAITAGNYKPCKLYKTNSEHSPTVSIDVYNYYSQSIPKNTVIIAEYSTWESKWLAIGVDCA